MNDREQTIRSNGKERGRLTVRSVILGLAVSFGLSWFAGDRSAAQFALPVCLPLFFLWVLKNRAEHPCPELRKHTVLLSLFFSGWCAVGYAFDHEDFRDLLHGGVLNLVRSAWMFVSLTILIGFAVSAVFLLLDDKLVLTEDESGEPRHGLLAGLLLSHPFLTPFALLLICSIPHIVYAYPSLFMGDTTVMLCQGLGRLELSTSYPLLFVYWMTGVMKLGQLVFGSWNAGAVLFSAIQLLLTLGGFAYAIMLLRRELTIRWQWMLALTVFYAVCPIVTNYYALASKDTLYGTAVLLFGASTFCLMKNGGSRSSLIALAVSAFFASFLRIEGALLVVICLIALAVKNRGCRRIVSGFAAGVVVLFVSFNNILIPSLGIVSGSKREILSIPLQQTGRYVAYAKNEVTPEEEKAILDAFYFYSLDEMAWSYSPWLSDGVKYRFQWDITCPAAREYYRTWFRMGLKKPGIYAAATLENYYQYFYPSENLDYVDAEYSEEIYGKIKEIAEDVVFHHPEALRGYREAYERVRADLFTALPLFALDNAATYDWLLLIWLAWLLCRGKRGSLLLCIPLLTVLLFCLVSPVNGFYGRYQYPMIISLPWSVLASKGLKD